MIMTAPSTISQGFVYIFCPTLNIKRFRLVSGSQLKLELGLNSASKKPTTVGHLILSFFSLSCLLATTKVMPIAINIRYLSDAWFKINECMVRGSGGG